MSNRGQTDYVIDVLTPDGHLLASFVSGQEAYRYATLLCEPERAPLMRRRLDGAVCPLSTVSGPITLAAWLHGDP